MSDDKLDEALDAFGNAKINGVSAWAQLGSKGITKDDIREPLAAAILTHTRATERAKDAPDGLAARLGGDGRHVVVPVDLLEHGTMSARTEDGYRLVEIAFKDTDKGNELAAILSGIAAAPRKD